MVCVLKRNNYVTSSTAPQRGSHANLVVSHPNSKSETYLGNTGASGPVPCLWHTNRYAAWNPTLDQREKKWIKKGVLQRETGKARRFRQMADFEWGKEAWGKKRQNKEGHEQWLEATRAFSTMARMTLSLSTPELWFPILFSKMGIKLWLSQSPTSSNVNARPIDRRKGRKVNSHCNQEVRQD